MADVKTLPISREELAEVFKSPRLIRAMENLLRDVSSVLPGVAQEAQDSAAAAQEAAAAMQLGVFSRRITSQPQQPDEAAAVLASRIFARR